MMSYKVIIYCLVTQAIDCMHFNGLDASGTYVITRIARRHGHKAEIWLTVNVPSIGSFQSPIHPDTNLYNVDSDIYSAGGLKYECLEPMKRWRIMFNGPMRLMFNVCILQHGTFFYISTLQNKKNMLVFFLLDKSRKKYFVKAVDSIDTGTLLFGCHALELLDCCGRIPRILSKCNLNYKKSNFYCLTSILDSTTGVVN